MEVVENEPPQARSPSCVWRDLVSGRGGSVQMGDMGVLAADNTSATSNLLAVSAGTPPGSPPVTRITRMICI